MTEKTDRTCEGDRGPASRARLIAVMDAYGTNPERWPEAMRDAGWQALVADAELQARLAAEASLDSAMDSLTPIEVPGHLYARLLSDFERVSQRRASRLSTRLARSLRAVRELIWPGAAWWQPAFAFSLSLLIGVSAGLVVPDALAAFDGTDQAMTNPLDSPAAIDVELYD